MLKKEKEEKNIENKANSAQLKLELGLSLEIR